jgi:hypothetical protein
MLAFEVLVNGTRRFVAGHSDARMLNVHLSAWSPSGFAPNLSLAGSVAVPREVEGRLETLVYPHQPLSPGDEITIRVIETSSPDRPAKQGMGGQGIEIIEASDDRAKG